MAAVSPISLVGREQPLRRLTRALDEASAGIGRLVLISGEPGVGKTSLAGAVLAEAERRGARTAVGVCWDGAGAPGLWPWVQVLRSLRSTVGAENWQTASGPGSDALARLLDSDQSGASAVEFHVFDAMLQLLASLASARPLVAFVDDLQWADSASVQMLEFIQRHATHLPLLVIATYRDDELANPLHPRRAEIAELARKALTIPLTGLDNEGIQQLRERLGVTTTTAEAEHLHRLTGGNPFFVIESVAFGAPSESIGVQRAIERRIDALGAAEQRVLTVASIIGREAPDAVVLAVAGSGARAALAASERAGLMRAGDSRHAFVHDLVRETLRDRLSVRERRVVHAAIVRAVGDGGSDVAAELLPAQIAWQATQAIPEIPAGQAVMLLEVAAKDASARLTHEAAGRHLEEAAHLAVDPNDCERLTLASGHAYLQAGALAAARERYTSLLDAGRVETRAQALLGLHRIGDPAAVEGDPNDVVRGLDQIAAELGATVDPALRADVMAARSRSRAHLLADDRADVVPLAVQALDLARSAGNDATLAACLLAYHDAIWEPGTEDARHGLSDELVVTGRRLGDPAIEAQGLMLRMVAEIELGDPAYARTHQRFDGVAEASRSPRLRFWAASRRGMIAALRANLSVAVAEIDAARALGERIGEPDATGMWCDQRWQVARHVGDVETIAELSVALCEMGDPHWVIYEALLAADLGDLDRANRYGAEVEALGMRWPRWAARLWHTFSAQLAILYDDTTRIANLIALLEPDATRWAVLGGGVLVDGPITAWLGRLAAAQGDFERAIMWSTKAEVAAQRLDAELWVLEARADRLAAQHFLGRADAVEITATAAAADARGLGPIANRLHAIMPIASRSPNVFRREHDVWTLVFDAVEARMPDSKGLRDLHELLANPRTEISATDLASDRMFAAPSAPPVLDARAKDEYRRRLDELDDAIDRAALHYRDEDAKKLEDERSALLDELRRATGLGGHSRRINDESERMRKAVTARIRDTLRRLDDRHPALAAHLRDSVRTGALCVYAPTEQVKWNLK